MSKIGANKKYSRNGQNSNPSGRQVINSKSNNSPFGVFLGPNRPAGGKKQAGKDRFFRNGKNISAALLNFLVGGLKPF